MPLFVLATPIGNLGDLSARARQVLAEAELILCEDTRVTRRLLSALSLPSPTLWRCDAWREEEQGAAVVDWLEQGRKVVLVSDAGTPALSDPGARVVAAAHAAGQPVVSVPGPSSVTAALSLSGLPTAPFHLAGFPPRKLGARTRWLHEALSWPGTVVFLEAGRRVGELLGELALLVPDREAALCREISKLHEEVRRGPVHALPREEQRGEVVLVVGPGPAPAAEASAAPVGEADSLKQIAQALARRWGLSSRDAYQKLLEIERTLPEHPKDERR